jgi:hypothetical protein
MKRIAWLAGLCVALLMFVVTIAMCLTGLVLKKHLNGMG